MSLGSRGCFRDRGRFVLAPRIREQATGEKFSQAWMIPVVLNLRRLRGPWSGFQGREMRCRIFVGSLTKQNRDENRRPPRGPNSGFAPTRRPQLGLTSGFAWPVAARGFERIGPR